MYSSVWLIINFVGLIKYQRNISGTGAETLLSMSKTEVGHNKADEISVMDNKIINALDEEEEIIHETEEVLMKNCDRGLENATLGSCRGQHFQDLGHSFSPYVPPLSR